jgi:hypothetical protein
LTSVATSHQIESKYDRMSEEDLIQAVTDRANKLGIKIDMSIEEQDPRDQARRLPRHRAQERLANNFRLLLHEFIEWMQAR